MLHGVKNESKKRYFINVLDCLGLFCWKFGLNGGSLYESYSVVSISIKKEVNTSLIMIDIEQPLFDRSVAIALPRRGQERVHVEDCA